MVASAAEVWQRGVAQRIRKPVVVDVLREQGLKLGGALDPRQRVDEEIEAAPRLLGAQTMRRMLSRPNPTRTFWRFHS